MAKMSFMFVLTLLIFFTMKIGNAGAILVHGPGCCHGDYRGYEYGHYGYYHHYRHRPQVVITVPPIPYYAPRCREIEVCNGYGECWLEDACN